MRDDIEYRTTSHEDLCLAVRDRRRLIRLKKVYFLMMRFPYLEKPLLWLVNSRMPLLCDLLFLLHFSYYIFIAERISPYQYFAHLRMFLVSILRRHRPGILHSSGAPYVPPATVDND